jgi:hypothetical protein
MLKYTSAIKPSLFALLLMVGCHAASAQTEAEIASAEYGSLSELTGPLKIFIFTTDIDSRQLIAKELAKDPKLTIVAAKEDADVTLYFRLWSEESLAAGTTLSTVFGSLVVAKTVTRKDQQRLRICWNTQKNAHVRWNAHPAVSATREFLKALKKANADKEEK